MKYPLDAFDRKILTALHEFEHDPLLVRVGLRAGRISPVPLYLLHAATCPLMEQPFHGRSWSTQGPDIYSRTEALKTLGLVRDGDTNWPELGYRIMRDGRFIAVDCELGGERRLRRTRRGRPMARYEYRVFHVQFGHHSHFEAARVAAGCHKPGADHWKIMESTKRRFRQMSWYAYDPVLKRQKCKKAGVPYRDGFPSYASCYSLTKSGIAVARETSNWGMNGRPPADEEPLAERPRTADKHKGEGRFEWARQVELVRAANQVLGEGTLNKGSLSRACRSMETNGNPGRAMLVRVSSFLAWIRKNLGITEDEVIQVRNAIMGEITLRN